MTREQRVHWESLSGELDAWQQAGRTVELWWRDDDADAPVNALRRLVELSQAHRTPLSLAVPPALTSAELGRAVAEDFQCTVLQHGYSHRNHAPAGEKKCELGDHRPLHNITAEISDGMQRMQDLFEGYFIAAMVPPWNRIGNTASAALSGIGFHGISSYTPRRHRTQYGLHCCNTHVDIVNWRAGEKFIGTDAAIRLLTTHLYMKRLGNADPQEPTGLLTHHLRHDEDCWRFIDQLLWMTNDHTGVRWLSAAAVFSDD